MNQPDEEKVAPETSAAPARFFPLGIVHVALVLTPFNMIVNLLAGSEQFGGMAGFLFHYAVAFTQSIFIYGVTFAVQNRERKKALPSGSVHSRSLAISALIVGILALGNGYHNSQIG